MAPAWCSSWTGSRRTHSHAPHATAASPAPAQLACASIFGSLGPVPQKPKSIAHLLYPAAQPSAALSSESWGSQSRALVRLTDLAPAPACVPSNPTTPSTPCSWVSCLQCLVQVSVTPWVTFTAVNRDVSLIREQRPTAGTPALPSPVPSFTPAKAGISCL